MAPPNVHTCHVTNAKGQRAAFYKLPTGPGTLPPANNGPGMARAPSRRRDSLTLILSIATSRQQFPAQGASVHTDTPGADTAVRCRALLQGIAAVVSSPASPASIATGAPAQAITQSAMQDTPPSKRKPAVLEGMDITKQARTPRKRMRSAGQFQRTSLAKSSPGVEEVAARPPNADEVCDRPVKDMACPCSRGDPAGSSCLDELAYATTSGRSASEPPYAGLGVNLATDNLMPAFDLLQESPHLFTSSSTAGGGIRPSPHRASAQSPASGKAHERTRADLSADVDQDAILKEVPTIGSNRIWVQCDMCSKWRLLPHGHFVSPEIPLARSNVLYPNTGRMCLHAQLLRVDVEDRFIKDTRI